jgi:hypothetical protein
LDGRSALRVSPELHGQEREYKRHVFPISILARQLLVDAHVDAHSERELVVRLSRTGPKLINADADADADADPDARIT